MSRAVVVNSPNSSQKHPLFKCSPPPLKFQSGAKLLSCRSRCPRTSSRGRNSSTPCGNGISRCSPLSRHLTYYRRSAPSSRWARLRRSARPDAPSVLIPPTRSMAPNLSRWWRRRTVPRCSSQASRWPWSAAGIPTLLNRCYPSRLICASNPLKMGSLTAIGKPAGNRADTASSTTGVRVMNCWITGSKSLPMPLALATSFQ